MECADSAFGAQKPRGFLRYSRYPRREHSSCQASSSTARKLRPLTAHNCAQVSLLTKSSDATEPVLIELTISMSLATGQG